MEVSLLSYCWKEDRMAGYVKWHRKALELVGYDVTINHLALRFNDWIVNPFYSGLFNSDIKWIKEKVSDRIFGKPCKETCFGSTNLMLLDAINFTNQVQVKLWTNYAWFYTLGLYKNKKDCVFFAKEMLNLCLGIGPFKAQTPYCLLKEISNHGYGSA